MTNTEVIETPTRREFQQQVETIIRDNHHLAHELASSNMVKIKGLIVSEATKGRQTLLFPVSKTIGKGFRVLENKNYRGSFIETIEEFLGESFMIEDMPSKSSLKISW